MVAWRRNHQPDPLLCRLSAGATTVWREGRWPDDSKILELSPPAFSNKELWTGKRRREEREGGGRRGKEEGGEEEGGD